MESYKQRVLRVAYELSQSVSVFYIAYRQATLYSVPHLPATCQPGLTPCLTKRKEVSKLLALMKFWRNTQTSGDKEATGGGGGAEKEVASGQAAMDSWRGES